VGPGGIEPPTSPLSGVRSSHLSYGPKCSNLPPWTNTGGAGRDRTGDLLNANQALSQLSYSPLAGNFGSFQLEEINRGQLDAETRRTSSRPFREKQNFKWRYQNGLTALPKQIRRFGVERLSPTLPRVHSTGSFSETPPTFSLRKEVIQPQVLLRLPCYDFTPIMNHTLGRCLPCGSACRLLVQPTFVM
jgi:hypothetical protein